MKKTVIWKQNECYGTEYLELSFSEGKISVKSIVISLIDNIPNKITYNIILNSHWVVEKLHIENSNPIKSLLITSNGKGQWFNEEGEKIHELNGAIDIDISCTPFTNSLPINRLKWNQNVTNNLEMVYIHVPSMTYRKVKQNYTFIKDTTINRKFYYQSGTYETTIEVDSDGLILDYPGLFTRQY